MKENGKKILIIAYFFPPYREVGAFRIKKLVKYFSEFGWDISVITVKPEYYDEENIDVKLIGEIPDTVKVIRTDRLKEFTKFKEQGAYWIKHLFSAQYRLLKEEKFDYAFYTGGPFIHFIIAPFMKSLFNQRYILDFRDPWLLSPYNNSKLRKVVARILEPVCVKKADYILNVTEDATRIYKEKYNKKDATRFLTISNGYDEADFSDVKKELLEDQYYNIVYAGKLGEFRDIKPLLDSIKQFNKTSTKKVKFYHLGNREQQISDYNDKECDFINELGFINYSDAINIINSCDIGIIISGNHPYEPTTKIYDYIALNKKIICINNLNYGYLYDTLNGLKGVYLTKNDSKSILETIKEAVEYDEVIEYPKNKFNRKNIFESLSKKLILEKQVVLNENR